MPTAMAFGGSTWADFKTINNIPRHIELTMPDVLLASTGGLPFVGPELAIGSFFLFIYLLSNENEQFVQLILDMDYCQKQFFAYL